MTSDSDARLVLDRVNLDYADYSDGEFSQLVCVGAALRGVRFDRARVAQASFGAGRQTSTFVGCSFDGARIRFGPGGYARFVRCSFRETELTNWFCHAVELVECSFGGVLKRAVFNGTVPQKDQPIVRRSVNQFYDNDFSAMRLIDVSFRSGIDLAAQRLPEGDDYVVIESGSGAVDVLRRMQSESGGDLATALNPVIAFLEELVEGGQEQLFVSRDTLRPFSAEAVEQALMTLSTQGLTSGSSGEPTG